MPRRLLTVSAALVLAALGGCSVTGALNAAVSRRSFHVETGLPYGSAARQQLDVYTPGAAASGAAAPPGEPHGRPVIVFFYGGSWQNGSRNHYLFVGAALASRGFVAVVPDYRTWPDTAFPGLIDDAAAAVRWARDHAAQYGGDPSRIYLVGHSAGAHIAMLLATDGRYLCAQQMSKKDLSGVIGLAGPYDFLPLHDATLEQIFPPALRAASQPINFVDGTEPPVFVAAGQRDTVVDPGNTDRLAARLRASGDRDVEVKHYPRVGHALLLGTFAAPLRGFAPVLDDLSRFVHATASREARAGRSAEKIVDTSDTAGNVYQIRRRTQINAAASDAATPSASAAADCARHSSQGHSE
jgi:acetyl esterase/lipase